jgi:tRNA threonylcarbamoyladenosine biosynthesis protein TsaB
MLLIGIETSTAVSSVALGGEQGIVASTLLSRGRGHAEFLVPAARFLVEQSGVSLSAIGGVAVGIGPGLFTGMRVGIATAKGFAQALGVPIVGISSLDLLAFAVRYTSRLICACIDARRGEVFAAFYRQVPGGVQRIGEYTVWEPERLAAEVESRVEDVLFIGDGALVYRGLLPHRRAEFASHADAYPNAGALIELALPRFIREETDSLFDLEPLYLRKADAQITWETRGVQIARPDRVKIRKTEGDR